MMRIKVLAFGLGLLTSFSAFSMNCSDKNDVFQGTFVLDTAAGMLDYGSLSIKEGNAKKKYTYERNAQSGDKTFSLFDETVEISGKDFGIKLRTESGLLFSIKAKRESISNDYTGTLIYGTPVEQKTLAITCVSDD